MVEHMNTLCCSCEVIRGSTTSCESDAAIAVHCQAACCAAQAAIVRAKAVKALGIVVQASQRLLQAQNVQESVSHALQVRRAAW